MEINKEILESTIEEFSKGRKELLVSQYTEMLDSSEIKELQMKDTDEVLDDLLNNDFKRLVAAFRKTEYIQSYKYSALFKIISDDVIDLLKILKDNEKIRIDNDDYFGYYDESNNYFILNFYKEGTTLIDNHAVKKERLQSSIVKLHKIDGENFFEISIDSIQNYYRSDSINYYINLIDKIENWINQKLLITCQPVNLNNTIDSMRNNIDSDFLVSAQLMNTNNGARATLDSASSTTIILPILGELKELIESNVDLFTNSQEGLAKINEFIQDLEEDSDLPWVSLINKTMKISIKFLFYSYTRRNYTLLNYYYHEKNREGMDYVTTKLLSEYSKKDSEEVQPESPENSGI